MQARILFISFVFKLFEVPAKFVLVNSIIAIIQGNFLVDWRMTCPKINIFPTLLILGVSANFHTFIKSTAT